MRVIALSCFGWLFISFNILTDGVEEGADISICSSLNNISSEIVENLTVYADTSVIEILSTGVQLSYSVTEIHAKAGSNLRIRYINESDMSHNIVVVTEEEDIRPVGIAALQAIANDWIPEKEMHRIIAHSDIANAGDTVEFSFEVPAPGTYPYICTYSAHWTQMQGRLISTE
ncbi:MAG TPA: plastocyanin/azurin family copper-binding protein [Lunatimonas sp.]|nr:plastocyanin/azurin family copper-binding protein [Lunatimonas sp.]